MASKDITAVSKRPHPALQLFTETTWKMWRPCLSSCSSSSRPECGLQPFSAGLCMWSQTCGRLCVPHLPIISLALFVLWETGNVIFLYFLYFNRSEAMPNIFQSLQMYPINPYSLLGEVPASSEEKASLQVTQTCCIAGFDHTLKTKAKPRRIRLWKQHEPPGLWATQSLINKLIFLRIFTQGVGERETNICNTLK